MHARSFDISNFQWIKEKLCSLPKYDLLLSKPERRNETTERSLYLQWLLFHAVPSLHLSWPFFSVFCVLCCCSVTKSCPNLCDRTDCSMPGFSVAHHLVEFAQAHVHWIGDAIQPSHLLLPSSPSAFSVSQYRGLFQWVSCLHKVAKVLELQLSLQEVRAYWKSFLEKYRMKANKSKCKLAWSTNSTFWCIFKEPNAGNPTDTYVCMFTAALFMVVNSEYSTKRWMQPKCLSTDEWINKMWSIHKMKFYSALKKNSKKKKNSDTWNMIDLEIIMINEIS